MIVPSLLVTRWALVLLALVPAVSRAEPSGSSVFIPDTPSASMAQGRSLDRMRDPRAWGIDDTEWEKFRAIAIASRKRVTVIVRLNNLRARQFKDDLVELLASIPGWEVDDQGAYTAGSLSAFDGILIQNRSAVDPADEALLIKNTLDAAGIRPAAHFDPTRPGVVRIVIGAPPDK